MKAKKYTYFIGVDISARELDWAVSSGKDHLFHRKTENSAEAVNIMLAELKKIPGLMLSRTVFCMEHTGIYGNHLCAALQRCRANFAVESATHIQNAIGNPRGKTDKMDAMRIADYAYRNREHLRFWAPKRLVVQQLGQLNALRKRLQGIQHILKVSLKQQQGFMAEGQIRQHSGLCSQTIGALDQDVAEINGLIEKTIAGDESLSRLMKVITSVSCIGPVTALNIILCTNEFKDFNSPRKFACYAGIAPFLKESGPQKGKARVSPMANKYMKSLLHICAVRAKINVPELKAFYERKVNAEKKHKMSVLNAIRYKLVLRVFSCVKQDRLYESRYQRPG
ncbi:hypothetical protein BEL04_08240 [Mucilaginibacter sp. PPCGB 2223]|uniref:transposase n=1 Tax=Mucilaginibacter sp. PPCGB 2223 TaxID=1886027 RepID=UPI000826C141|nr:transposase [Mucilaginibacter sp. PPCGB 2223]OCX54236.1 hypothetical protein BEL04_08240 [Mucilaginibacter sp. PPCGB 2223]